jgi:hypothetical protein
VHRAGGAVDPDDWAVSPETELECERVVLCAVDGSGEDEDEDRWCVAGGD